MTITSYAGEIDHATLALRQTHQLQDQLQDADANHTPGRKTVYLIAQSSISLVALVAVIRSRIDFILLRQHCEVDKGGTRLSHEGHAQTFSNKHKEKRGPQEG